MFRPSLWKRLRKNSKGTGIYDLGLDRSLWLWPSLVAAIANTVEADRIGCNPVPVVGHALDDMGRGCGV